MVALRGLTEKVSKIFVFCFMICVKCCLTKVLTITSHNLQMVVAKTMCEIFIIMANGQRYLLLLCAMQLQVMIVSIFKQKVKKMVNEKG